MSLRVLFLLCILPGIVTGELINPEVSKFGPVGCDGAVPCVQENHLGDIGTSDVNNFGEESGFSTIPQSARDSNPNDPCPKTDPSGSGNYFRQLENQVIG
jgi:hypothetical protein